MPLLLALGMEAFVKSMFLCVKLADVLIHEIFMKWSVMGQDGISVSVSVFRREMVYGWKWNRYTKK